MRFKILEETTMPSFSIRLPDELEERLVQEARLENKPRSELVREAIAEYVTHRERERFVGELAAAARALSQDRETRSEVLEIEEDLIEEGLDALLEDERIRGTDSKKRWWKSTTPP